MDRLRLGLLLLALAPVAWMVALFVADNGSPAYLPSLLLMFAGLAVAAWAAPGARGPAAAAGLAIAALAILWFYDGDLLADRPNQAGGLFFLGCAVAAVGAVLGSLRTLGAGLAVVALAAALWIVVDGFGGGLAWQPGNVLAFAGGVLAALGCFAPDGPT